MKRNIEQWTIKKLIGEIKPYLGFPEFQREPAVWDLIKKQKLIDSILRGFDIAPIYLYKKDEENYECIDGRQRINAIYSFLGENKEFEDSDNDFKIKIDNEIYDESDTFLLGLNGKTCAELKQSKEQKKALDWILDYKLNVIVLDSDVTDEQQNEQDLSLQFIRLQLASALNAGEKLHAMSGDMHDFIFSELFPPTAERKKKGHPFFSAINIPYRRFAREQVAAQIALNYFSLRSKSPAFSRSRYIDLQYFFKRKTSFNDEDRALTKEIKVILDKIVKQFGEALCLIENRALAVTTFLFAAQLINDGKEKYLPSFAEFLQEFIVTLKWQLKLYRDAKQNAQYREIFTDFQNYITQAAGESYAIERRHKFIEKYFEYYLKNNEILGDKEFKRDTGKSAKTERSNAIYKQVKLPEG